MQKVIHTEVYFEFSKSCAGPSISTFCLLSTELWHQSGQGLMSYFLLAVPAPWILCFYIKVYWGDSVQWNYIGFQCTSLYIHHPYTVLCAHHPESVLLPPYVWPPLPWFLFRSHHLSPFTKDSFLHNSSASHFFCQIYSWPLPYLLRGCSDLTCLMRPC